MTTRNKSAAAIAVVAVAAGIITIAVRHDGAAPATPAVEARMAAADTSDLAIVQALNDAKISVQDLMVRNAGGIVVLRGTATSENAERAAGVVRGLGHTRVANLIVPEAPIDDDGIRREVERQLATTGSLGGCVLRVSVDGGVVRVTGKVRHELQKDAARDALRGIRGAQRIHVDLERL
ncbi:MAG TPA: BON domain-containing protein [Thermoanaerobaculia bacterium]|nr:BON domain-containing protein [Thermoanaerobaculia bacterium]